MASPSEFQAQEDTPHFAEEAVIDSAGALEAFVERVRGGDFRWCAVDTEADSMHSYETKLCLIQFSGGGRLAVIDPLALSLEELDPFLRLLGDAEVVWMHGADYDMAMFRKTFGWIPARVWDTQTAARLVGVEQFGLASLIESEFGVKLSKQSQKADWGKRPLPDKMISYAFNDVRFLLELADRFLRRLRERDRVAWFEESCEAARAIAATREERASVDAWRVTGWGNLAPRGMAYLKALWDWRDEECRAMDRPAFKLVSNQDLLSLAERLQNGERVEPPRYLRPPAARRLLKAVAAARGIPESEWPRKIRGNGGPRLQIDEALLQRLRDHRNQQARALGIDGTLISPRAVLEKLAASNVSEEEKDSLLLGWQREVMGRAGT